MKNDNAKVKLLGALRVAENAIKSAIESIVSPGTTIEYIIWHSLLAARKEIENALECAGKNDANE